MKTITVSCQICRKPVQLQASDTCPDEWVECLSRFVTCNPCHTFTTARSNLRQRIHVATSMMRTGQRTGQEFEHKVRPMLATLTRRYAELICRRQGVPVQWEPDFIEQLIDHPDKTQKILGMYETIVERMRPS